MQAWFDRRRWVGTVLLVTMLLVGTAGAQAEDGAPPVDLNKASVEQLIAVKGIGKVTAERIVAWRDQHGPFRRVEDLMKVKGIGEKSFEKIRPHVKVSKGR